MRAGNLYAEVIYRLLVSHLQHPAAMVESMDPAEGAYVVIPRTENVGSLLIYGTGYIPDLEGRLNPILDTHGHAYLYADNIAINGGKEQPATFKVDVPIEPEDANGTIVFATVKHIQGQVTLLQYTRRS